jgi:hypothetical protein
MGEKESVLNFAQRLRGKVYEANVVDENVMVTIFINALSEPLKNQVSTRMPATLEQAIHDAECLNHRIRSQAIVQEATLALAKAAIKPMETPEEKPRRAARAVVRAVEDDPAPTDKKGEADRKEPRPLPVNRDQNEKSSGRDQGGERRDNRNGQSSAWNGQRRDEGRPRVCYGCGKPGHMRRDCPTTHPRTRVPTRSKEAAASAATADARTTTRVALIRTRTSPMTPRWILSRQLRLTQSRSPVTARKAWSWRLTRPSRTPALRRCTQPKK